MSKIDLNALRDRAYKTACEHGFHDEELSNEHCLMLVITELSEAIEADRKGKYFKGRIKFERDFNLYSKLVEENVRYRNAFEKHMHACREKDRTLGVFCKWCNCQKDTDRF